MDVWMPLAMLSCAILMFTFPLITYEEHALQSGSNSQACAYVGIQDQNGTVYWGAGIRNDIIDASAAALISAVNKLVDKRNNETMRNMLCVFLIFTWTVACGLASATVTREIRGSACIMFSWTFIWCPQIHVHLISISALAATSLF